jgi:hypothetical protein
MTMASWRCWKKQTFPDGREEVHRRAYVVVLGSAQAGQ